MYAIHHAISFDPFCTDYSADFGSCTMCLWFFFHGVRFDLPTLHFYRKLCHLHQWPLSIVYCNGLFSFCCSNEVCSQNVEKRNVLQNICNYSSITSKNRFDQDLAFNAWHIWIRYCCGLFIVSIERFEMDVLNEIDGRRKRNKKQQQQLTKSKRERENEIAGHIFFSNVCFLLLFIHFYLHFDIFYHTHTHMQLVQYHSFSTDCFVFFHSLWSRKKNLGEQCNDKQKYTLAHTLTIEAWMNRMSQNDYQWFSFVAGQFSFSVFKNSAMEFRFWTENGDFHWWYGIIMVSCVEWVMIKRRWIYYAEHEERTREKNEKRMKHSIKSNNNNASIPFVCAIVRVCTTNRMVHFFRFCFVCESNVNSTHRLKATLHRDTQLCIEKKKKIAQWIHIVPIEHLRDERHSWPIMRIDIQQARRICTYLYAISSK